MKPNNGKNKQNIIYEERIYNFMENRIDGTKKAEINMRFSEFEMPPMQDVLIVGKMAPIGPEAVRRMVDILSPDQYEIVKVEHNCVEAIVVRKTLMNMLSKEKLISVIMEEGGKIANQSMVIKAQIGITLSVSKSIDI